MSTSRGVRSASARSEQAIPSQLDHLHTSTPALAGLASKAATSPAASRGVIGATRRVHRRLRFLAAIAAVLATGVGFTLSRPAGAATAAPNSVTAHGAAELGSPSAALVDAAVDIAATPERDGYWVVAGDGGVFTFGDARYHGSTGTLPLVRPIAGIAPTPTGDGYWLVADDGGVFSFGDARFFGSLGAMRLNAPIVGIAASPTGEGYWLVAQDGGVFSFGDARFHGSTGAIPLSAPVVGIAATPDGDGYVLAGRDGAVFAFGGAEFAGSAPDPAAAPAVGVTTGAGGAGYVVAREDGHVLAFGTEYHGNAVGIGDAPVVGIASGPEGYWLAHGAPPAPDVSQHPFLVCTRRHESDTSGGYRAVSASGTYRGAYQFSRSTWNSTAARLGRHDLVGVDPAAAAPVDQDLLALALYSWQGSQPWGGRCSGM
jgi:hypothetical protein